MDPDLMPCENVLEHNEAVVLESDVQSVNLMLPLTSSWILDGLYQLCGFHNLCFKMKLIVSQLIESL